MRLKITALALILTILTGNLLLANEDFSNNIFSKYITSKDRDIAQYTTDGKMDLDVQYYEFEDSKMVIKDFKNFYNTEEDLIYSIGMYFIDKFEYNIENSYPGTTWDDKAGNCTGLTQIYKEILKEYNVNYYVLTGYLDETYHMLLAIEQEEKWYLSDMSMTVSNDDVGYMKTGYYDRYKFDYVPVDLQPYREWYLGDKNLYYKGQLYSTEFEILWIYNNGLRIQQTSYASDIIMIDGELYYKDDGGLYAKVEQN